MTRVALGVNAKLSLPLTPEGDNSCATPIQPFGRKLWEVLQKLLRFLRVLLPAVEAFWGLSQCECALAVNIQKTSKSARCKIEHTAGEIAKRIVILDALTKFICCKFQMSAKGDVIYICDRNFLSTHLDPELSLYWGTLIWVQRSFATSSTFLNIIHYPHPTSNNRLWQIINYFEIFWYPKSKQGI